MAGWRTVGATMMVVGLLSILCGVLAFFPAGSYHPWFISWDAQIAGPVWTGALATITGASVVMANRDQNRKSLWEVVYVFSILTSVTCLLMFAVATAAVLTGPLCYYSYRGAVGIGYLSHAVRYPYPYQGGPGLCLDPLGAEWYHLVLHTMDLLTSTTIFILSLGIVVILTKSLLHSGHVSVRG
ncbi:transmembrane protein 212-like [Hypomesus transpacificus]|uniref:transmembrane protein 212-like n=1 Tax=Hypomesus transpacificus TaxID=137520 RepID=UPI001F0874F6|nr:transmembrane protein 212-like [Hypomesus transpacificus]